MGSAIIGLERSANLGNTVKLSNNGQFLAIGFDDAYNNAGQIDVYKWSGREKDWVPFGNRLVCKQAGGEF